MSRAVAPTRADLAGGTLDIWPLSLLVEGALTVNAALSIKVEAEVRPAGSWSVEAIDRGVRLALEGPTDASLSASLPLVAACLQALPPAGPVAVTTKSPLPEGSGLGGSSALCVALLAALGGPSDPKALTNLARDVEGRLLGMPPGFQDAAAAAFGGVAAYHHQDGGWRHEDLGAGTWLEERALVFYGGASRFSGANNWEVFKAAVEGDPVVLDALGGIARAARGAARAVSGRDAAALARALAGEMDARKRLAPGILTPQMEAQFEAATAAGALAAKVCGAGGGGCAVVLAAPDQMESVATALRATGATPLDASIGAAGVLVE